jgi:hypothetical protein
MFSTLRTRYGIPGLIATAALVFAMTGGAFAAKYLITSTKGAQGPQGAQGAAGPQGEKGATGAAGTNGKSVVTGTLNPGQGGCAEGGVSVEVEGSGIKKSVCNGKPGVIHPGETLPSEATETGAWAFGKPGTTPGALYVAISFPIPLSAPLVAGNYNPAASPPVEEPGQVHYINTSGKEVVVNEESFATEEVTQTNCPGSAAFPEAEPGHLCVYEGLVSEATPPWSNFTIMSPATSAFKSGASTTGAVLQFTAPTATAKGSGTWAVTAP